MFRTPRPPQRCGRASTLLVCVAAALAATSCLNPPFPTTPTAVPPQLTEWRPPAPTVGVQIHYTKGGSSGISSFSDVALFAVRADGAYDDVSDAAEWTSSDPAVAIPPAPSDSLKRVRGLFPGTALIGGSYDGFTDFLGFTVGPISPRPPYLEIQGDVLQHSGQTVPFAARLHNSFPSSGLQDVTAQATWSSSDTRIATVDGAGRVTARQPGWAEIRAAYQAHTAFWRLTWKHADSVRMASHQLPATTYPAGVATDWSGTYVFELVEIPAATAYFAVLDRHHRIVSELPVRAVRVYQGGPTHMFRTMVTPLADSQEVCSQVMLVADSGTTRTYRVLCRPVR